MQLDLAAAVDEIQKRRAALATAAGEAAGDAVQVVGFLADGEVLVGGAHVGDRLDAGVGVGEIVLVGGLVQAPRLGAPLGDQLLQTVPGCGLGRRRRGAGLTGTARLGRRREVGLGLAGAARLGRRRGVGLGLHGTARLGRRRGVGLGLHGTTRL